MVLGSENFASQLRVNIFIRIKKNGHDAFEP